MKAFQTGLRTIAVLLSVLLAWASGAHGKTVEGAYFEPRLVIDGTPLVLQGVGLKRYLLVYKVSVTGFYLGEGIPVEKALADTPKRLEVQYLQAIKAEDFAALTNRLVRANVDEASLERLRPKIERLNALYENVRPGDRYSLTYLPGKGLELALNGKPAGTIPGAELASAVFSMWLGPEPLDHSLKAKLLGRS